MRIRARYVIALLLLIPLADAAFLVFVADRIGGVTTVALVVLTGLIGMLLVRAEGRHTVRRLQEKLASAQIPTAELLDGGLLIAAGAFLLTPGLVTDVIGFLLAVPPTRYPLRALLDRFVLTPYIDRKTGGLATGVAWTGGFPGDDGTGGVGGTAGSGAGGPERGGSGGAASGGSAGGRTDGSAGGRTDGSGDDVVDVDPDDYSVEEG